MKKWLTYIMVAMFCIGLASCADVMDEGGGCPEGKAYLKLSRSTISLAENETLTLNSVRILVFDSNGHKVSNKRFSINETNTKVNFDSINHVHIIEFGNDIVVEARQGVNAVYLVLNEEAFGANLTSSLDVVANKEQMETVRNGKVSYNIPIKVNGGEVEPAFVMCTHDDNVLIDGGTIDEPYLLDMTGTTSDSYGYGMRRSMAKVVLESVEGGKYANGEILSGEKLIETSAVHILGIELINVPNSYSWKDEREGYNEQYNGEYLDKPINFAEGLSFNDEKGYYERVWLGKITVSGVIPFSRTDALKDLWKTKMTGADYGLEPSYNMSLGKKKDQILISNKDTTLRRGANSPYDLNMGNFVKFFNNTYWMSDSYTPGSPVPGIPQTTPDINPAVWSLVDAKGGFYVPENIVMNGRQTKIRVTAAIATPTAYFEADEIQKIIDEAIKNGDYKGEIVVDEGQNLDPNKESNQDEIFAFLLSRGRCVKDPEGPNDWENGIWNGWGITYGGFKRIFKGETEVSNKEGYYTKIADAAPENRFIFELPLNNDTGDGTDLDDHNVYRGCEYRIKLYIVKEPQWSREAGNGLCPLQVKGKIIAKPML